MRFVLTYDGLLRASGNKPKPEDKWNIRKAIHPQLDELYIEDQTLRRIKSSSVIPRSSGFMTFEEHHSAPIIPKQADETDMDLMGPLLVGDHPFVPLVRQSMGLVCAIDIIFLRKEDPGALIKQGGDIDNRIKTLFDGLKMPSQDDMRFAQSSDLPNPFYCLLEEDSLITDVSVRTHRLLTAPAANFAEVRLIMEITIRALHVRSYNLPLIG